MSYSPLIQQLVTALTAFPGVGSKTAQRMAFYVLEKNRGAGIDIANALLQAVEQVKHCGKCRTLSEQELCNICASTRRDASLLCVVENPTDVFAIEHSNEFNGYYFVLSGSLSPIDGVGPDDIGIPQLIDRVSSESISEVILATSTTLEGEATAFYIAEQLSRLGDLSVSRIAHGVPLGGELEYVDGGTIARAIHGRMKYS